MSFGGVRRNEQENALNPHFRDEITRLSPIAPIGKLEIGATICSVTERRDAIPGANPLKEVSRI